MKYNYLRWIRPGSATAISAGMALAITVILLQPQASGAVLAVNLGTATDFAVLAGAGITVAGAVNTTEITGDIGSYATTTITGLENVILNGDNHGGDSVTQQAKIDLAAAFTDAIGRVPTATFPPIYDLGGLTLGAGVYNDPSSLWITGILTLDAGGDPNAVWIFQAGSTLITGSGSSVAMVGGGQASNVFWVVGSSATLGTASNLQGTIMASESITLNTGAELTGRALAKNGAVTMDFNTVNVPEVGTTLLLASGLVLLVTSRRRVA